MIKRDDLAAFGVMPERIDDFFDQVNEKKRAGDQALLSGAWICETLGICTCVLSAMVDAGKFPAPVPDD
jgi:hypothetical protein